MKGIFEEASPLSIAWFFVFGGGRVSMVGWGYVLGMAKVRNETGTEFE